MILIPYILSESVSQKESYPLPLSTPFVRLEPSQVFCVLSSGLFGLVALDWLCMLTRLIIPVNLVKIRIHNSQNQLIGK